MDISLTDGIGQDGTMHNAGQYCAGWVIEHKRKVRQLLHPGCTLLVILHKLLQTSL